MSIRSPGHLIFLVAILLTITPALGCGGDDETNQSNNQQTGLDAGVDAEDEPDAEDDPDVDDEPDAEDEPDTDIDPDADPTDTDIDPEPDAEIPTCEEDEYVEAEACTTCPAGTTNEAGDDPTGGDTSCDAILCEVNQRVEDNACVACGADLVSWAGADASGPNTECFTQDTCFDIVGVDCDSFNMAYIKSDQAHTDDQLGHANAINADGTVFVSTAPYDDGPNPGNVPANYGSAIIFTSDGDTWSMHSEISASNQGVNDQFGSHDVAIDASGDTIIVGARLEDSGPDDPTNNDYPQSGAAYVFEREVVDGDDVWTETAILKASDLIGGGDEFGSSVDISADGNTIVVGAPKEDSLDDPEDYNATESGAAYVFFRDDQADNGWTEVGFLKADNAGAGDGFGGYVAVDGSTIAVSAQYEDSMATGVNSADNGDPQGTDENTGAVYIFSFEPGVSCCTQEAYIKASNTGSGDRFGYRIALAGDVLAVGASGEQSNGSGIDAEQLNDGQQSGAVYVFRRTGGVWAQEVYIKAPNNRQGHNPGFGFSLGLNADGSMLAATSLLDDSSAFGLDGEEQNWNVAGSGAVYLFTFDGDTWTYSAFLKAPNSINGMRYGKDPAFSATGEYLAVGAYHESGTSSGIDGDMNSFGTTRAGAVFIHRVAPW